MSGNNHHLAKKAYEIAYAIFRIVPNVSNPAISQKLTSEAAEILTSSVAGNYNQAIKSLETLNYLIKFAIDLNFISFNNGEVLIREISNLQAAVAESINAANQEIDISGIFSAEESAIQQPATEAAKTTAAEPAEPKEQKSGNIIKSGMRQIAILDRIRQYGSCRMRDIQEVLPDCSERTLRYDLEDLMERNIIERIGNGGPSVSYRIRQLAQA